MFNIKTFNQSTSEMFFFSFFASKSKLLAMGRLAGGETLRQGLIVRGCLGGGKPNNLE